MNVRCGICGNTYGCECASQEQLFVITERRKCTSCGSVRKNLCGHDADIAEGFISATRKRPRGCLNSYDPTTAEIPF